MRILLSILLSTIILSVAFQSSITRGLISWQKDVIVENYQWGSLPPAALECAVNCFMQKQIADNHNPNLPGLSTELEKKAQLFNPDVELERLVEESTVTREILFSYISRSGLEYLDQIFHPPRLV